MIAVPWFLFVLLHILFMIFSAAGEPPADCAGYAAGWVCNSPFEPLFKLTRGGFGLLTLVIGGFAAIETFFRVILFDYDMLRQPGLIMGSIGIIVQIASVCTFFFAVAVTAYSFVRR